MLQFFQFRGTTGEPRLATQKPRGSPGPGVAGRSGARPGALLSDVLRVVGRREQPAEFGGIAIVLFLGLSLLILALSFREFARAKTSVRPDHRADALIQTGPFACSRNPLYVAVVLLILGIGVWVNSTWIWVMVAPLVLVMNTAVIVREERHLEQRFGREYTDYKKAVRRWL